MSRLRVTIAGMMGLVALAAAGLTAFRYPSPLAASGVFSLAIAILFAAWVAAICLRGRARAIWASFALCGSGYLYLSTDPLPNGTLLPLVTTPLIELVHERLTGQAHRSHYLVDSKGEVTSLSSTLEHWTTPERIPPVPQVLDRVFEAILLIAHAIFSLGAASAGGLFAFFLTRKSNSRSTDHP